MRAFPLLALALLAAVPSAAADPIPPCDRDPCVEEEATAGSTGADAAVTVNALNGVFVGVHAGPDAVLVFYGAGITRCTTGVDLDPLDLVFFCAV